MREMVSVAVESVVREKGKHALNLAANGSAAALVEVSVVDQLFAYAPLALSLVVSLMLIRKTYLETKLVKIELAKEGRRDSDH